MTTARTAEKVRTFLSALADTCNVSKACKVADVPRAAVYEWRSTDPAFAAAWEEARAIGADLLEDEAVRRAHDGIEEFRYNKDGEHTGTVVKYSDTLLIFLLNGAKPDKYRQRVQSEISGPGGAPIAIDDATATDRLAVILAAAHGRKAQDASDLV